VPTIVCFFASDKKLGNPLRARVVTSGPTLNQIQNENKSENKNQPNTITLQSLDSNLFTLQGFVNNHSAKILIDSGADENFISKEFVTHNQIPTLLFSNPIFVNLTNNSTLPCIGTTTAVPFTLSKLHSNNEILSSFDGYL